LKKIHIAHRNSKARLEREGYLTIDVTSRGPEEWRVLSPFYPHGGLPVPGMEGTTSDSVEGIWQGLKVFDGEIAPQYFTGRGKKRRGRPEGHKNGGEVIDYVQARDLIYIPSYMRMVRNCPKARAAAVALIKVAIDAEKEIYLLDFNTNADVCNTKSPLSHASVLATILLENLEVVEKYHNDPSYKKEYDLSMKLVGKNTYIKYPLANDIIYR